MIDKLRIIEQENQKKQTIQYPKKNQYFDQSNSSNVISLPKNKINWKSEIRQHILRKPKLPLDNSNYLGLLYS